MQTQGVQPTNTFVEFRREDIEQSVPARFEQQVRKTPDRLAIKSASGTLSYDALNHLANRVARAILAQRPHGPETVALLLDHGAPMIVAMLGVLKAGHIYVPLDPVYPQARTTSMLEDSQARLMITDQTHLPLAQAWARDERQVLNIDGLDADVSDENLALAISPDALAYVVYTSGSTGQPKGVMQTHRNVLHQIMIYTNALHICADDRLTLLHSCSFSAARSDIFGALLNGATVCPVKVVEHGLVALADWLIQEDITILHWVPTAFRHFIGPFTGAEAFPNLRLIVLGSESVLPTDVALYKTHFAQGCLFVNRLGTTETADARLYFMNKETPLTGSVVPVGYAVADTEVLVLDEAGQAVGVNQTGEIAIKSRYLSPGYWRQPDLTRAAFLADPDGGDERIYRTGDLGYLLPDGCLVHVGRRDFQVKVHGYRIEIAEIELVLLDLDTVKEAVVVAWEEAPGDQRLIAYVVPCGHPAPTVSTLRQALAARLPPSMIPSAFEMVEALPLTPTGKVNRRALPAPGRIRPDLDSRFVAPRTPAEEVLTGIWAHILGLEQVGIHDNFFELGGLSILATQRIARVREALQVELPLRLVFEAPTVSELAMAIIQSRLRQLESGEMRRLLAEVEGLSEAEAQQRLAREGAPADRRRRQECSSPTHH